jgi:outer membrane protein OmpA-like peptidoglycan-associated protein
MAAAKDSTVLPPVMDEALVDVGPRTAEHTRIHLVPRDEGPAVDTRDQNAAVGRSQPFIGNRENDPAREASQQGGRNKVVAGEMNLASEFGESLQPPVQPLSAGTPFSEEGEDHRRWLVNHQRSEIVFWNARAEELEQQLRRRTAVLATLLVCAALSALASIGILLLNLAEPRPPDQARVAASPSQSQAGLPLSPASPRIPPASNEAASEATVGPAEENRAGDISSLDVLSGDRRIAGLEHDLAATRLAADEARREADQLAQGNQITAAQAAQELQARTERIATLERDAGAAEQRLAERAAEIDRLTTELRDATKARDELEAHAAERTQLLEQASRGLQASTDQVKALERGVGSLQQQVQAAQQQSEERRTALGQQLASMTQSRDQAAKALEVRDQRIASLEGELAQVREAAERSRAEAQRLAEAAREAAELRSTAAQENQRPAAPEAALSGTADGPHRTVLASGIFVAPGSNQLAARAAVPLREAADLIQQSSGPVRIVGHMNATGDPKANRQLSLRRAEAVRDYLVFTYRFDPARFKVEGRGSDEPVAANDTAAGRRANRRVEILFSG